MRTSAAAILLLFTAMMPALAGLSRAELTALGASPQTGARLNTDTSIRDADGKLQNVGTLLADRTGFLVFVDYTCTTLCGTDLMLLSQALQRSRTDPGRYRILVIGLDPKDTAASARAMERKEIPASLWRDTVLLLPNQATVTLLTRSLGFRYAYDPAIDQFAHPATVYAIASDGRVRATLSPFALSTADIDAALDGSSPGLWQRVRLLCYAFDPATGIYTFRIRWLLRAAALVTLLSLGTVAFLWARRHSA